MPRFAVMPGAAPASGGRWNVLRALARGHRLCPESMVSGGDNRPFLLQFQFFGHTGTSFDHLVGDGKEEVGYFDP
jgi:hypothetical protein